MDFQTRGALQSEFSLLHLLVHRNRNQHHAQLFWRPLTSLHGRLRIFLLTSSPKIASNLLHQVIPACYWHFNTFLNQAQFITLALALLGALSNIYSILKKLGPTLSQDLVSSNNSNSGMISSSQEGSPIIVSEKIINQKKIMVPTIQSTMKAKTKAKSKSKSKTKSTMDSIFG